MKQMPFISNPEVQNAPAVEQGDLRDAQKTEQLVYEYKVKREEMLAIFDEVKQYLSYEDVLEANAALQEATEGQLGLSQEAGERLAEYVDGSVDGDKKHLVLFEDFQKLLQENPRLLSKTLGKAIKESEERKVGERNAIGNNQQDQQKAQQEIKAKTLGKLVRSSWMLKHFAPLQAEIAEMSEDDLARISTYGRAHLGEKSDPGKVRTALLNIKEMKAGIGSAKSSKNVDVVRREEELAKIHGVSVEEAKELNAGIEEDFLELFGERISLGVETKYDKLGNIVDHDFMTAYVNYNLEMKNLYRLLNEGKIVETGYVKEIIERALPALTKNPPSVVYFHGDQGTGKTALATHIAKTRFGKEPIIVAGSKYMDPDKFTEEFKIQKLVMADFLNMLREQQGLPLISNDMVLDEVISEVVSSKEAIREKIIEKRLREDYEHVCQRIGREAAEEDFAKHGKAGAETIPPAVMEDIEKEIDEAFSNSVQGRYVLMDMFQAMMEGRPLIIDEANAISPDVLIAFNDLMTKKIGDVVKTKADIKEFKIKDGYCVMWTGNTGERFKQARFQDMDPAAFSRIVPIKFEYLPQSREVNNMDQLLKRLELNKLSEETFATEAEASAYMKDSKRQAATDQIFQVMLVKLLNKRLGTELLVKEDDRYSVFKDIYRLGVGSRIIMDLFEGKVANLSGFENLANIVGSSDVTVLAKKLKKSNLTMRELMDNIIGGYLDEGCSMDIEFYLFKFVKKYDAYPEEQAILYSILQKAGFFGTDEKWPGYQDCRNLKEFENRMNFDPITAVDKYKKIQKNGEYVSLLNTGGNYKLEYFSSMETLQLLFGYLPPRKKADYEAISKKQKELMGAGEMDAKKRELLESIKEIGTAILDINLYPTAQDARELTEKLKQFKLNDPEVINMSDEEFFERVDGYHNVMLEFLHKIDKISDEELAKAQTMNTNEKSEFIKGILGNNS